MGFLKKLTKAVTKIDPVGKKVLGSKVGKIVDPIGHKMVKSATKKSTPMVSSSSGTAATPAGRVVQRINKSANSTAGMRFNKR